MALTELLRALELDAASRAEALRESARREAARVRAEAQTERERRRTAVLLAREAELRGATARQIEDTRRLATARRLEARAAALGRIRQQVERRLARRGDDLLLLPLVRRDLLRALEYAGGGASVARTSPAMAEALRAGLNGRATHVRLEGAAGVAGVLLGAADGSCSVDATFRSRLDRSWPRLAIEVVRRLECEP